MSLETTVKRIVTAIINNPEAYAIIKNLVVTEVRAELVAQGLAEYISEVKPDEQQQSVVDSQNS